MRRSGCKAEGQLQTVPSEQSGAHHISCRCRLPSGWTAMQLLDCRPEEQRCLWWARNPCRGCSRCRMTSAACIAVPSKRRSSRKQMCPPSRTPHPSARQQQGGKVGEHRRSSRRMRRQLSCPAVGRRRFGNPPATVGCRVVQLMQCGCQLERSLKAGGLGGEGGAQLAGSRLQLGDTGSRCGGLQAQEGGLVLRCVV